LDSVISLASPIAGSVILKLVHPLATRIRARWVWSRGRRHLVYVKLDPVKVAWIIREKENGARNETIASSMNVSVRRVQELYSSYKKTKTIPELGRPGRRRIESSDEERRMIADAHREHEVGAVMLERVIDVIYDRHVPHNRIHRVMKSMGLARDEPRKQIRKKWIRYERKYSNSLWHTDWTLIDGMGWLIAYLDDASRFVLSYGLFPEATSQHSVDVLKEAIKEHGKPASILTDRGIQFYANEAEERVKGSTVFERYLVENEIRHILARVSHPQTNGKVERFFGTVKTKLPRFDDDIDRLMTWYNTKRPHMSLNLEVIETPYQAYLRKMPDRDGIIEDEEAGEGYHAQKS
jgi:putative transposase